MRRARPKGSCVPGVEKTELSWVWWRGFVREPDPRNTENMRVNIIDYFRDGRGEKS